jgi:hypothetical protein
MLTRDQVIVAGIQYLLLEACGDAPHAEYSLILLQNETFDYVVDNPGHPQCIITVDGWDIHEEDDAKYDIIYEYLLKQRTEEIANEPDFWQVVENVANELGIECEWATEEAKEAEYETIRAAIGIVIKWLEKPTYDLNTLEYVQQRICANWIEHEATHRVMVMNLSGKALEGWLAILKLNSETDERTRLIQLINHAQEIINKDLQ